MQHSRECVKLVVLSEGLILHAYQDSVGVWTIGYGHTKDVHPGDQCTAQQAIAWLNEDLLECDAALSRYVTVSLTQNQWDALADWIFNLGAGAFQKSTGLKLLNAGQLDEAIRSFSQYIHAGGKVLPGLVKRREAEMNLFLK